MEIFERYRLERESDGYTVVLYLNPGLMEFSDELGHLKKEKQQILYNSVSEYIKGKFPDIKVKTVKIVVGSMLFAVLPVAHDAVKATELVQTTTAFGNYTVVKGDTLWAVATKTQVTVTDIKSFNNLTSDSIFPNQILKIPTTSKTRINPYIVVAGDTLWSLSRKFSVPVDTIKRANNLITDSLFIGQYLIIPVPVAAAPAPAPTPPPSTTSSSSNNYTVVSGDTLWGIAKKFNITVDAIRTANKLTSDYLSIGQVLIIPVTAVTPAPPPAPAPSSEVTTVQLPDNIPSNLIGEPTTITYKTHTVASGDTIWGLAVRYGIPATELQKTNNLTDASVLSIGQTLRIPVHNIPVQPVMGAQYGEYLDWWTQAQYIFTINKVAKVTDLKTGRSFNIMRTIGAFHADSEPLTAADAAIMKEIWGGSYSWTARPVILEINGRRLAAGMSSMPHDIEYIKDNNFDGHFDIHFLNSLRHKDGLSDPYMQAAVKTAAGLQ